MTAKPGPEDNIKNGLPGFIVDLLQSSAYPHPTGPIELRQTHISYVILTGQYVYKVKKPVNFGFLDFSALDKREHFCQEEVRLNRRLCPSLYVGVVEVSQTSGQTVIGRGQKLIDYAVKMIQLPEDRMMVRLLDSHQVTGEMMRQLAGKLARFYHIARGDDDVTQYGTPDAIQFNTEENFRQTQPFINDTISTGQYQLIKRYTQQFILKNTHIFLERIKQGRIRDGHGDLRPDSVCFTDDLCVFDCIEFNERFRCGDVAADIAFLIMELEMRGEFTLARHFIEAYVQLSDDQDISNVLNFYKVYRAYVRGKVESLKLQEREIPRFERQQSRECARRYFELAATYVAEQAAL